MKELFEYLAQFPVDHHGTSLVLASQVVKDIGRAQVSNDVDDSNALWCLGQYVKVTHGDLVPTGRWF